MKIKWGILGAGWIADKFVSDFKLVDNGEVVAVAARSLDRASEFANNHSVAKAYGSYQELVEDANVDIIYVATTHNFHFEHTKLCLNHNKSVLCEKPATVNANEFKILQDLASSKSLFYMEAMWTAFLPGVLKAMEWVKSGAIGDVEVVQANFGFPASPEFTERLFNPNLAGGALLDVGIYPLTIIQMFADSALEDYKVDASFTSTNVDGTLTMQMKYKNGIKAQMATSILNRLKNDAFICGTKGFIEIHDFWMTKKATLTVGDAVTVFEDDTDVMGYNFEVTAVNDDLLAKRTENRVMNLDRTKQMMELMDDIRSRIGLKYPFE